MKLTPIERAIDDIRINACCNSEWFNIQAVISLLENEYLRAEKDTLVWISVQDELPPSDDIEECNEYYLIYTEYGAMKAMYISNEWWSSYSSKIMCDVTHWKRITNPFEE